MALTGEQLVDEVRAMVGREGATNSGVITDARVTRWLNEGQREICERIVGINNMLFRNTDSLTTSADMTYAISDITIGDKVADPTDIEVVNHIYGIHYIDGANSVRMQFVHTDEWDKVTDPTSSDFGTQKPIVWTRRGDVLEIRPIPSAAFIGKNLRIDGDAYAGDFTTNDASASDISDVDEGLIRFATAKAWGAIGDLVQEDIWMKKFTNLNPLGGEREGWLELYKRKNDELHEWNGDVYSDYWFSFAGPGW